MPTRERDSQVRLLVDVGRDRVDQQHAGVSTLVSDDPVVTVARLKAEGDGHLVMYGCGRLARTLLAHDLVDEVGFFVFPVLLGNGTALFRPAPAVHLRLRSAHARPSGVVSLSYASAETA
jgi:dihydrofolate reductase